jgi:hypothetical protein
MYTTHLPKAIPILNPWVAHIHATFEGIYLLFICFKTTCFCCHNRDGIFSVLLAQTILTCRKIGLFAQTLPRALQSFYLD